LRPLTNLELLQVWENGLNQPVIEKTLLLLSKACAANTVDEVGRLSIGNRDAKLMQLREWTFGRRLENIATCPHCGESIEWESDVKELYLQSPNADPSVETFALEKNGFNIKFRLPDSFDMLHASTKYGDSRKILAACVLEVYQQDKESAIDDISEEAWDALNQRMAQEDPQADIEMNINCPACLQQWEANFDIVQYLWAEINNWAQRTMQEVYLLARAFGWPEKDILTMSSYRRQLYIEMLKL
jgi:hypothetical protein